MTSSARVLAVEDSPTQAAALRVHLAGAGFEVSLATNGAEALAMLGHEAYDLIVSDIVMPDVDGYELCRRVKEGDSNLPVLLLTSLADPMDVVHALTAGADNFLRKPYKPTELVQRVRSMLYNRELRSSGRAQMGLELFFLGRRFMINADREQILDLLVSTFEDLVDVNDQLRAREEELADAQARLIEQLTEAARERDRLGGVLAAVPEGMAVVDAHGTIVRVNEHLTDFLGECEAALVGRPYWEAVEFVGHAGRTVPPEQRTLAMALASGMTCSAGNAFDLFVRRPDGHVAAVITRAAPIHDHAGGVVGAVGTMKDIAELVAHDPVTGLPGQAALIDRLQRSTAEPEGRAPDRGLLVVAIDRFERLREGLPSGGTEEVVATMADRLRVALNAEEIRRWVGTAMPANLGNGELAVVLTDVDEEGDLIRVGEHLVEQLAGPVRSGGHDVPLTVTVAGSLLHDGGDPAGCVSAAATAARHASAAGGDRMVASDPELHADVLRRLQLEDELRTALATEGLVVHYQPEIRLWDGQPRGVEALVRWQHPQHGLLGAGEVIPLAIEAGLIAPLGWKVLHDACDQAVAWRRTLPGGDQLRLSVNFAAEQLADADAHELVGRIIAKTGFDPTALTLEVTEVGMMRDPAAAARSLQEIKALGVRIAIDDFGTGYSSLLQLRRLPIDVLKVDQAFVGGMVEDPRDGAIVAGTIRLARTLGLDVVAEGVETSDQLVQLRVLGCDAAQGYHWSRPLPAEELATWWTQHSRTGPSPRPQPSVLDDERDDDVIAYLVHELRTPLTAVLGFAELLAGRSEEASPEIAAIVRNANEANHLLGRVGDARAALEGGTFTLRPESCDIVELIESLATDLSQQLHRPINVRAERSNPITITVDLAHITQAVTNLLSNAVKFSPAEAPVEVTVSDDGHVVTIAVRDHGAGIPEHRRPELFRRFSRLGSRTKGMGIGLYLSRVIVDAHGGTLQHHPAPDGGAVFSISLPHSPPAPDQPVDPSTTP